jgi:hypothetical protein
MCAKFWLARLKERSQPEDIAIDGRIVLKLILGGCELDHVAQDGNWWSALLKTVMNLRVS